MGIPPFTPRRQAPPPRGQNVHSLWVNNCQLDAKGNPIPNLFNATIALQQDHEFAGKLVFNQMLQAPVFDNDKVEDQQLVAVHQMLQAKGLKRIGLETVHEAVRFVAYQTPVHPLRDWLKNLHWDDTLRLTDWLATYLGADSTEYTKAVGVMFLIGMVARIFQPGCQMDYMLVLEGDQGILKSQACRVLAGNYFSDTLPELGGTDAVRLSMHLRGKWLIEIAELSAFSRADASALKSFVTRQEEIYTPKFFRVEVHEPRQCCFVGTTNDDLYLKDDTGGRRFWPVKCGAINVDALARDRDQLFAEAVDSYQRGAQWWPARDFEKKHIKPVQATRLWIDAWEAPVRDWLKSKAGDLSLVQIAFGALDLPANRFGPADQRRLGAVLKHIGWVSSRSKTARFWSPPP